MKVALYLRYSGQEDLDKHTLALQEQAIKDHCQEQNYSVVEVYKDPKHSRFNLERPALQKMLNDAKGKHFRRILVYDQTRFSGDIAHSRVLRRELAKLGIDVLGVTDFPRDTLEGQFVGDMTLLTEEFVKKKEALKSVAVKKHRAKSGYWVSPAPFGYIFNKKQHLLEKDPEKSLIVSDIFTLAVENQFNYYDFGPPSINEIARRFNMPWGTIQYILKNRVYLGEVIYQNQWYPGIHDPLVPARVFDVVQERFN